MDVETSHPVDGAGVVKDKLVSKSNSLVEASYRLTTTEQRMLLCAIATLDSRVPSPKNSTFVITARDYALRFGVEMPAAYEALKEASARLWEREIKTIEKSEKGTVVTSLRWLQKKSVYNEGEGKVSFQFSNDVLGHLTLLHARFTSYELRQITNLSSNNAIRIYELLAQYKSTGFRFDTIEHFRYILGLENEYPRFYDLKKRVLDPAIAQINKSTDLEVSFTQVKTGRNITGIKFDIKVSNQQKLPL